MKGTEFKKIRAKLAMTQGELAEIIGVSSALIVSHYEAGFRNPSLLIQTLMRALDRLPAKRREELIEILKRYSKEV